MRTATRIPTREDVHDLLVPCGHHDHVTVEEITINALTAMRAMRDYMRTGRGLVHEGDRIRTVYRHGRLWMSDSPDEWKDQRSFLNAAADTAACSGGSALVTGLGLGMTTTALIVMGVPSIDVVEIDPAVIALVGTHLQHIAASYDCKLWIHEADAFTWKPAKGQGWTVAWHDIWPDIRGANVPEMQRLRRRFCQRVGYKQFCWVEKECKRALKESDYDYRCGFR